MIMIGHCGSHGVDVRFFVLLCIKIKIKFKIKVAPVNGMRRPPPPSFRGGRLRGHA